MEPAEPCVCGDMAHGDLWSWDRHRAYLKWTKYRILRVYWGIMERYYGWRYGG